MSDNNPYESRDHESSAPIDKSDVMAVASLLGQVTGSLKDIDSRNVGGQNKHTQAVKMDPKQVLKDFAGAGFSNETSSQPPPVTSPQQGPIVSHQPPVAVQSAPVINHPQSTIGSTELKELRTRVTDLEKIVESYKRVVKFKRGVSYLVSTTNIKGTYKQPQDILDIVSSELAKQTKTITLKLNVTANKDKQQD